MTRVLQFVACAAGSPGEGRGVNGPELRALNMLRHLDRGRIEMTIAYGRGGRLWDRFLQAGARVVEFDARGKFDRSAGKRVARLVRQLGCDVVHVQGPGSLDRHVSLGAGKSGTGFVITRPVLIEDLLVPAWRRAAYGWMDRPVLRNADVIVAVSDNGRRRLAAGLGSNGGKVRLIRNGVDLERFIPGQLGDRRRFGVHGATHVVGMSAQLTPAKSWGDYLAVVTELRRAIPGLKALVIGDGPLRMALRRDIESRGLGNSVVMTGHLDEVQPALSCLDLFLSTSRREGLSVAVIEAMAAGLPCIITEVGGARELVGNDENGFLVPAGDVQGMATHAIRVLGDEQLRARLGRASRARALRDFDECRMTDEYQDAYEEAAHRARSRVR